MQYSLPKFDLKLRNNKQETFAGSNWKLCFKFADVDVETDWIAKLKKAAQVVWNGLRREIPSKILAIIKKKNLFWMTWWWSLQWPNSH